MVPPESQTSAEENSSMSVDDKEQLVSGKDQNISTAVVHGVSSLKSKIDAQEDASFMDKSGKQQQFDYQPNIYACQPQTLSSGGYLSHLGQWEECPHFVNAEGLDTARPMIYGSYFPLPTIGDSQPYFFWNYPFSSPYYQPPGSPSIGYLNSSTGMLQFDPMHLYYVPDELLYSPAYGFYQPFGSFKGTPIQLSGTPGYFWPGNIPLNSQMHQESMYRSGSYKALQQVDKYEGATPSWGAGNYRFSAFNKSKHGRGSLDFLNELNRGPRTTKTKKEEDSSSAEGKKKNPLVDSEQYNHPEFITEYKDAKFFVIKSYTEDHVHKSIKYNVWSSTDMGNRKLNAAYRKAKETGEHCPIFLFFSVNGSGQFCGVAEMIGPVDFDKSFDYWQHKRWSGRFPVKWHIVKDLPNNIVRHIILENNEKKPVTNSKDTQEVKLEQGLQILAIFKSHEADTTILEDFDFYERREKAMLDNRMEKMKVQCPDAKAQKVVQGSAPVDLVTHISATFTKDVQPEEAEGKENGLKVEDTVAAENDSAAPVRTEDGMPRTAEVEILSKEIG
ncbi:hypothetical protein QOZ80_4BG0335490 [Eleusine coracana subsp. coracana]|nr:hypothetical protein QOZ80_4BG0335490 [Eleusine coracana subsp. coracana]